MSGLTTKTIVITGASRGLGLEFVRQLSDNSHHRVIAVVRNPEILLQSSILARKNVYVVKGDLSDLESFSDVAAKISEVGNGKVDILINNAGVMVGAGAQSQVALSRSTPDEWAEQFKINVLSLVFFTIALLPLLEHGEDKKVINLGSFLGDLDFALAKDDLHYSSYSVTKAAVNMANIKFHNEFKHKGFTFISLNPGWVNTDLAGKGQGVHAPLQPEESISRCLGFIHRCGPEQSGKFFSLDGSTEPLVY